MCNEESWLVKCVISIRRQCVDVARERQDKIHNSRELLRLLALLFPARLRVRRLLRDLLAAALVLLDQLVELFLVLRHRQLDVVAQRRHHVLLGHAVKKMSKRL